ncbi:MAG: tetratricopeptide repeat protein [Bacteroidota bacterium]
MLETEPNDSFLNYGLALEYGKMGEIQKSIELLESLIKRDENYLGAYYQLGKFYELTSEKTKAISTYTKGTAIAKTQNNRKTLSELNEALFMLED